MPKLEETVYYVSAESGDDGNDGLTPESPLQTLYRAIELSAPGDAIKAAGGTYQVSETALFPKNGVLLQGGFNPDFSEYNPALYQSVITSGGTWA